MVASNENESRRHPDVFTPEEAAEYLRLDSERSLETIRDRFGLVGYPCFGKALRYYRKDLDEVLLKMVGRDHLSKDGIRKMRLAK